nr:hypothetical protein CFP56_20308 [Quercus suber]
MSMMCYIDIDALPQWTPWQTPSGPVAQLIAFDSEPVGDGATRQDRECLGTFRSLPAPSAPFNCYSPEVQQILDWRPSFTSSPTWTALATTGRSPKTTPFAVSIGGSDEKPSLELTCVSPNRG